MNREQKIDALISIDMDNLFTNHKELEHFVANVLRNGMKGWNNESDEVVNDVYIDIFEENE